MELSYMGENVSPIHCSAIVQLWFTSFQGGGH